MSSGWARRLLDHHPVLGGDRVEDVALVGLVECLEHVDRIVGVEFGHRGGKLARFELTDDVTANALVELSEDIRIEAGAKRID